MKELSKEDPGKDKSRIEINRDLCKGCRICVAFCPKEVLELGDDEKAVVIHPEKCNACGLCELRCPDIAIELKQEKGGSDGVIPYIETSPKVIVDAQFMNIFIFSM